MSTKLLGFPKPRAFRVNRRGEARKPASGGGWMELSNDSGRIDFKLMDTSPSGFCAGHHYGALSAGQKVRFQHDHAKGTAVVIWNRVLGNDVRSGFLIVADSK